MFKNYSHKRKTSLILALVMVLAIFAPILEHPVLAEGTYGTNAYKHIEHLSQLEEPRVSGTESEVAISEYIKTQFESYGYKTKIQKFSFENRKGEVVKSQNVVAIKPGTSEKQLIVGAHYDQVTSGGSKGAHDNASGVGAILEVAERIKDVETPQTIVFVAFGSEEVGLKGSKHYVDNMTEKELENTEGMINLDSIIAGDKMYVYAGSNGKGFLRDKALSYSKELGLDLITQGGHPDFPAGTTGDWSDHAYFNAKGIPVLYFESTNWDIPYEDGSPGDGYVETTVNKIMHTGNDNLEYIEKTFPGRIESRLNTTIQVLEKMLVEVKPMEKLPEGMKVSNDLISLTDKREIEVTVNLGYKPNVEDLKWTLGDKDFSQWKKWDSEKTEFAGSPWIFFSKKPYVDDKGLVKATIKIDLPFDSDDLNPRPYPRWAYMDLLGNYELKVVDVNNYKSASVTMKINAFDDFHLYDEIKPALDEISKAAKEKKDRYFEYQVIGKSVEDRDMHFVVIAKDKKAVDNYLNNTKVTALKDPKKFITAIDNKTMGEYQIPIFINNVHPDESPGIDAQISLMKNLINEDEITFKKDEKNEVTLKVADILDDVILVFNLTQNPDGRYHNTRHNVNGFDLNRDNGYQVQPETKALTGQVAKWNPIAFLDLHGFVKDFLIEPCTPPHEPNFEYDLLMGGPMNPETKDVDGKPGAIEHARAMGEAGIANSRYDHYIMPMFDYEFGWDDGALAYTGVFAQIHGAMGHTVEMPDLNQHSNDAVVHAMLGSINYIMENKDAIYRNQLEINRRSIENEDNRDVDTWHIDESGKQIGRPRGENENFFPEYYILPLDKALQKNPLQVYNMVEYLMRNGVIVEKSTEEVEFAGVKYPAGSIVVSMRQAKRGIANSALYDGSDESRWEGMYAELVSNFPAMRGFDKVEVREVGLFDGKTEVVDKVVIPTTKFSGSENHIIIRNTNNDAIKAVNKLLADGKKVSMLLESGKNYEMGDFVVSKVDLNNIKNDYYLDVIGLKDSVKTSEIKAPKIKLTPSGSNYASTTDHTRYVLQELGFEIVDDNSANVVVDASGKGNVDDIKSGRSYIGIGSAALKFVDENKLLPGFQYKTTDSYHEGLLKGNYAQDSTITAPYDVDDYMYIASGSFITKAPKSAKVLATISDKDDFYIAGWWPGHDEAKGQIYAITDKAGCSGITLFAGDITNKAHPEHLFRMLANALYTTQADDLSDISGHWAEDDINKLVQDNIITGYKDGSFKPDNKITRAEFVTILVKAFCLKAEDGKVFADTEKHWAVDSIRIANANGIVDGYSDTKFGPDDYITREQMAVMITKAARTGEAKEDAKFKDMGEVSSWAASAVNAAKESGIISGYNDNTFRPKNNAKRAEAVKIITNTIKG